MKKFLTTLAEILAELLLTLLALLIGYGVFCLFGQEDILERLDPDLVVLLGILLVLVGVGIVSAILDKFKKKR